MTEDNPMDPFETRLAALVRRHTEPAAVPGDPLETARTAMASATGRGELVRRWPSGLDRRVAWLFLLAGLLVAVVALGIAGGSRPSLVVQAPDGPERIVFVRDGDLYAADGDGSGQTLIATGNADDGTLGYLTAAWSPDMRHIAAVRDTGEVLLTPAVDLMTADGTPVRTVALDPGCGPSLSWSPDSAEVAIGTCPAEVRRDTIAAVESGVGLLIAGLDATRDREIALPADWRSFASANPEVWLRPDLWARWSPDGRWIALLAMTGGDSGWHLVAADGSGTRRVDDLVGGLGTRVDALDWSPDGRRLAIAGGWVGCATLCLGIVDPEGRAATITVAHPTRDPDQHAKLFGARFSPDGDEVAVLGLLIDFTSDPPDEETYTIHDYDLATTGFTDVISETRPMVVDATGAGQSTGVGTLELLTGATVAWTPDGRRLVYLDREAGDPTGSWTIRSVDVAGGSRSSILVDGVRSFDLGPAK